MTYRKMVLWDSTAGLHGEEAVVKFFDEAEYKQRCRSGKSRM